MPVSGTIDELSDLIARLQLVSLGELRECRESLNGRAGPDEFLDLLQRKQLLTGYQVEKLAKLETDGLILGGCKLLYRNAAGSFARLYRAASLDDGSMVAMKVLRDRWAKDPDTVKLFHREGEIGRRLKHPAIVPIYAVGQDGDDHYITMEFVEGGNFRDFLKIRGKLDPIETCRHALNMADGLEYALNLGITHRDLKLTNVLMSAQGQAKLIDFGLGADESILNRTDGPDLQQALEYSTLEKGSNAPRNDPRSDLYFLGTILYELLTGVPPYPRTREREERKRFSRYRDIRPVTAIDPRLPHRVADVVDRLLHTNPDLRYQRPAEVAVDLRAALASLNAPVESAGGRAAPASSSSEPPKVLFVENRPKHQDVLRDYLGKRGYRVLLLGDAERAVSRIKQSPPDCLVLMGHTVEDDVIGAFFRAVQAEPRGGMAGVLVLSEKQASLKSSFKESRPGLCVLVQPVSLRDLRQEIGSALRAVGKSIPDGSGSGDVSV
jgi:serine/threonine protein kinase